MDPLDIRDIAILDALPFYEFDKIILNVGCGKGRIDYHLAAMGFKIFATDIKQDEDWQEIDRLTFHESDIFDLHSFPIAPIPVVICSQVLEHLKDYKIALKNLIILTHIRLIITVPFKKSFHSRGHVNFWDDNSIREFAELGHPYSVSISRILTKPEDAGRKQSAYLIILDKRQKLT